MNTTRAVVKRRPEKKFRPVRDFNPWSLRYRCSALLTELTSQLGAGHYIGSKLTREVVNKRLWIYEIHIFELLIKTWIWKRSSRCTNIAEVMGSNPVQAWIFFFRSSFHNCSSSVHYCEDRFHIHVFIRRSNIWLSYIHSRLKSVMQSKFNIQSSFKKDVFSKIISYNVYLTKIFWGKIKVFLTFHEVKCN